MAVVELRHVTKVYQAEGAPVTALEDVSLEIRSGELAALIGRSGCGKSTLLNLCGAMDFPTSGEVLLNGHASSRMSEAELTRWRRGHVGFVFQSFQLLHTLSAVENVELPLLLQRRGNARAVALERLRWVDLASQADRPPHQLSGGQQQRIAIARALVHDPSLLLADEPTGNLDTATGEVILDLLRRTVRELGVAVVIATHSPEVIALADRIVPLSDGRVVSASTRRAAGQLATGQAE